MSPSQADLLPPAHDATKLLLWPTHVPGPSDESRAVGTVLAVGWVQPSWQPLTHHGLLPSC